MMAAEYGLGAIMSNPLARPAGAFTMPSNRNRDICVTYPDTIIFYIMAAAWKCGMGGA